MTSALVGLVCLAAGPVLAQDRFGDLFKSRPGECPPWAKCMKSSVAQERSTLCQFTQGPRAGQVEDWARITAPNPVGAACNNLAGSTGVFISRNTSGLSPGAGVVVAQPTTDPRQREPGIHEPRERMVQPSREPAGFGSGRAFDQYTGTGAKAWGPGLGIRDRQESAQRNYEAGVDRKIERQSEISGSGARLREEQKLRREYEANSRANALEKERVARESERAAREWLRERAQREGQERVQREAHERAQREAHERVQREVRDRPQREPREPRGRGGG